MSRKLQRATLAASFVVTTTALVACGSAPMTTHNPPPTVVMTNPPTPIAPMGSDSTSDTAGPSTASAEPTGELSPAPEGFPVHQGPNGTCYIGGDDIRCGDDATTTCNPPPLTVVKCPK